MKILLFLLILIPSFLIGQNNDSSHVFERFFYHIAVDLSNSNPSEAIEITDLLYKNSKNKIDKLELLMLKANILKKQEKFGEAIHYALVALQIADNLEDHNFQSQIYGFLSSQYRAVGFLDKGKEFIKKGKAVNTKIACKITALKQRGMIDYEAAEYALEERLFETAIGYFNMAILSYKTEQNIQTRNVLIGSAEEGLGRAQMGLNNKKTGLAHFIKAVGYIDEANLKNTFLAAEIYKSLGKAYLENNSADSAKFYLKKAMQITKNSDNLSLKQSIYKCTSEVYKKNKMIDSFVFYDSKFNDLLQKNNAKKRATVNLAYRTLNTPQEEAYSKASYVVMGTGVLTCFFIIGFVFKKRKKTANEVKKEYFINNAKTPELVLSQKLEDEILKNLNKFEHSKAFLDKSMSLSTLIGKMNTNTKYFRYVLKKHKEKDFKGYINELRIKYIVRKLKTDPQYLNFKISYLANESGFSSHSKFSAVFKQVMGLSPSEFIENINHNI